jgi:hypothetical protein
MVLSHPHDPIQRYDMESKDLWVPKYNMCALVKGKEKNKMDERDRR